MRHSFVSLIVAAAVMSATAVAGPTTARASVMSVCAGEWKQAQAAGTTGGQTWPQFLSQCRARQSEAPAPSSATIAPAPAPAPGPAPASQSGSLFPWWQPSAQTPAPATASTPTVAGEFATELQARARCPSDTVVWVNTKSRIYHYAGTHNYGHTRKGAYMCEADTRAAGNRAAREREASKPSG